MSAADAIKAARVAGVELRLDGDDLVLEAQAAPPPAVLELLRRHKAEIVARLRWPEPVTTNPKARPDDIAGTNHRKQDDSRSHPAGKVSSNPRPDFGEAQRLQIAGELQRIQPLSHGRGHQLMAATRAFDKKPLTRRERADNVKKRDVFAKYGGLARAVLDALLAKYADEGVLNLDDANVLRIAPFTAMGSVMQLITAFNGREGFEKAVHELQDALYQETA